MQRYVLMALGAFAAVVVLLNLLAAYGATHPLELGKTMGVGGVVRRDPGQLGLTYETVTYGPRRDAWWIPAAASGGCVVIVHGYDTFTDPKSGDPGPLIDLAAQVHGWGYDALIINLGYTTGAHLYSGGKLEADDVAAAVRWCRAKGGKPVVVWGFSAGGSASLLAAANGAPVAGVVADSAFADAGEVIVRQFAQGTHLPKVMFALVPPFMSLMAAPGPENLPAVLAKRPIKAPLLLIQGTSDRAIPVSNLDALQRATGAPSWKVPGADHIAGFKVDTAGYLAHAKAFLKASLAPTEDVQP